MGGAVLSFCAMAVSVRELSGAHDPFQILFFRSLFGVLVLGLVVARLGPSLLRSPQWGWHAIRHSVHFAAQAGWVYSGRPPWGGPGWMLVHDRLRGHASGGRWSRP